jgi:hypothetical protein
MLIYLRQKDSRQNIGKERKSSNQSSKKILPDLARQPVWKGYKK